MWSLKIKINSWLGIKPFAVLTIIIMKIKFYKMRIAPFIILLLFSVKGIAQTSYSGFLGKYPITMVMFHYSDGDTRAYYVYDKYNTPIIINGRFDDGKLTLFEKDNNNSITATIKILDFDKKNNEITGQWTNTNHTKTYKISLKKDFDISYGEDKEWNVKELLQSQTTKEHYFKTIITKEKGDFFARITGIKIYEKKTDRLIQTIELDCQLSGIDNVRVGDYNFDGIQDFSVFEASYAGPNTSSIYILRNPDSEKYTVSDFQGTSLEFDSAEKLIYEHNQCCAGTKHMTATYKVVNNKMVLIDKECLEYDDKKEDFIKVKCEQ